MYFYLCRDREESTTHQDNEEAKEAEEAKKKIKKIIVVHVKV